MADLPRIGSDTESNPNTMIDLEGNLFHPDNPEDAAQFAEDHEAWFMTPDLATMRAKTAAILGRSLGGAP